MPKPITPMVSCDVFITNEKNEVLLIKRPDSKTWATPGGFHDLGETPKEAIIREVKEETTLDIEVTDLIGVFSSIKYPYIHYKYTKNEITQLFFAAKITNGTPKKTKEALELKWFSEENLPKNLFDGHEIRIKFAFKWLKDKTKTPYFE